MAPVGDVGAASGAAAPMQLKYAKTVIPASDAIAKVTSVVFSPNHRRLAVATHDLVVHLFDEQGERRDRFHTKPSDANALAAGAAAGSPSAPAAKPYSVVGLAFSPDSTKLAVAQSDCIVFVYKLGADWGARKSICNKYPQSSAPTCICWPSQHENEVVFGLAEGKVKLGNLRTNRPSTIYTTESYVVGVAASTDGTSIVSAHLDGSIYRFLFDGPSGPVHAKLVMHPSVPTAIAWGASVLVADADRNLSLYSPEGRGLVQRFELGDDEQKEFTCAAFSPSGECCVVGSFNKFHLVVQRSGRWELGERRCENMYTIGAIAWKQDGGKVCVAGLTGGVDLYDAHLRRYRYKDSFEMTYVSPSQVIVKNLNTGTRVQLKSQAGTEIQRISIQRDQYLVAHTSDTVLVGDLESCLLSEVPWHVSNTEKFFFEHPAVCMIYRAGELVLIEYGSNEVLGSCRTELMSPHFVSVRIGAARDGQPQKRVAYLMDVQTVCLHDLVTGVPVATIANDVPIDWLELSANGNKLLFRDKKSHLHLYDVLTDTRVTLLDFCQYVQWVPDSEVVVAQSGDNLSVWYSIEAPDRPTIYPIKGEVVEIERTQTETENRTVVVVDEGGSMVTYALDDAMISFGTALESGNLIAAAQTLRGLQPAPENDAMWRTLAQRAIDSGDLLTAEVCYSALGDAARARFIHKTFRIAQYAREQQLGGDGLDYYAVRARLAALGQRFTEAEHYYLDHGEVEQAMEMYQDLMMFDEALRIAKQRNHPRLDQIQQSYTQHLLKSHQEDIAAEIKEREGDLQGAVTLFLQASMPARAATIVTSGRGSFGRDVQERVAAALLKLNMFERAGDFFEKIDQPKRALDAYRQGKVYRRAVELAKREFADDVVPLEEEWGAYLMQQHQPDQAIKRFIEAGKYRRAMEAAVAAKQWQTAIQIASSLPESEARPFLLKVASSLDAEGDSSAAEKYYVACGHPEDAVGMYIRAKRIEQAERVARSYMGGPEASALFVREAQRLEGMSQHKEAEQLFLAAREPDFAINMYKKAKKYDDMLRLVAQFHKDLLGTTHLHLAKQLEQEGSLRQAEGHYVSGGDWQAAVKMYRSRERWEDALRVARTGGGTAAGKQVAYAWALSIGGKDGAKLLHKLGLVEQAIEFLCDIGEFEAAVASAQASLRSKVPDVYYKHAIVLEDQGKFAEAEVAFLKAGKPREVVDMYIHQADWASALRVAENHDQEAVATVLLAQAERAVEAGDTVTAEQVYLRASRPDLAVRMYATLKDWANAQRVADDHAPSLSNEVRMEAHRAAQSQFQPRTGEDPLQRAKGMERRGEYSAAIECLLGVVNQGQSADTLEETWVYAARLAAQHMPARASAVAQDVASRLVQIGRPEPAAELLLGVDLFEQAVRLYVDNKLYERARRVVQQAAPHLATMVEEAYNRSLIQSSDTQALLARGNVAAGLDVLVQQDRWDEVLQLASEHGADEAKKYAVLCAARYYSQRRVQDAVVVLARYGGPGDLQHVMVYTQIARAAILEGHMTQTRDMLSRVVAALKQNGHQTVAAVVDLNKMLSLCHFALLRDQCESAGMADLAADLATAMLRYVTELPADRAFFEAGRLCRAAKRNNHAVVFWNRFLDLCDNIDEDQSGFLDNADFQDSDIPYDFPMPTRASVPSDRREEARSWVLAVSMESEVEQALQTKACDRCNKPMYEAGLICNHCAQQYEECVVSGYPVHSYERVACTHCNKPARMSAWNTYVQSQKMCPWCNSKQSCVYSAR